MAGARSLEERRVMEFSSGDQQQSTESVNSDWRNIEYFHVTQYFKENPRVIDCHKWKGQRAKEALNGQEFCAGSCKSSEIVLPLEPDLLCNTPSTKQIIVI